MARNRKMAYVLRKDYFFRKEFGGERIKGFTYHICVFGLAMGVDDPAQAQTFATKAEATAYARKHLRGRGYNPEPINAAQ